MLSENIGILTNISLKLKHHSFVIRFTIPKFWYFFTPEFCSNYSGVIMSIMKVLIFPIFETSHYFLFALKECDFDI